MEEKEVRKACWEIIVNRVPADPPEQNGAGQLL